MHLPERSAFLLGLLAALAFSQDPEEAAAAEEVHGIASATGIPLESGVSKNFIFAYSVPKSVATALMKVADDAFAEFQAISGVESWKEIAGPSAAAPRKPLVGVLGDKSQYLKFAKWYADKYKPWAGFQENVAKAMYFVQGDGRVVTFMHMKPLDANQMRHVMAHEVGHLCAIRYKFHNNFIPPWLEEGLGTWIEAKVLGRTNCYCFAGGYGERGTKLDKMTDLEWARWKGIVLLAVRQGDDKSMRAVMPLQMSQLSAVDVGKAWSVIDWMIAQGDGKFIRFLAATKKHWPKEIVWEHTDGKAAAQETALKQVFETDFDRLDQTWREWVKKTYKPVTK